MGEVNVAFASPNYGPMWSPVVASWLRVVGYTSRYFSVRHIGNLGGIGITDRMYIMAAENKIVEDCMAWEDPPCTHIFMTESDMVLPHDCIVKLLEMDKDIASGIYFLRSDTQELRGQPCLYKRSFEKEYKYPKGKGMFNEEYLHTPVGVFNEQSPFRCEVAGLGCTLIKREVFETIKYPWFDLKNDDENGYGYGSDMYFYTKVRQAGFEAWVNPKIQCGQVDYYINGIADYHWQLENNPQFRKFGFIVGYDGNPSKT